MIRFYVKVLKARQSGNAYAQLFVDLGYRVVRLDKNCSFYDLIPELCGYRDLDDLLKAHSVDDVITLAEADERASVNIYKIMTPFPL